MPELGTLLEREMEQIRPAGYTLADVARTRDRRRRNQRIGTVVVALVIAGVAIGGLIRAFGDVRKHVPASTPTNGRIAFVSPGDGGPPSRLYTVAADGSDPRLLTAHYAEYPDWTSDGSTIAFDSGQNLNGSPLGVPNGHILTVNADGTGLTRVTGGDVDAFGPSWSPDGTHLAVAGERPGSRPGIFILDLATGDMTRLTTNPYMGYWDAEPDYSPDGTRIAFIRVRQLIQKGDVSDLTALFVVNVDGSGLRRLTPWDMDVGLPSWSPDGSTIAFNSKDHSLGPAGSPSQILVIGADGTGQKQLTSEKNAASFWPSWSPDGSRIVFTRFVFAPEGQPFGLYTMKADGSDLAPLPSTSATSGNESDWGTHP
jgi:TolB protein